MKGRISICSILSLYCVISCRMGLSFAVNVATGKSYNQSSNYSSISYPATDAADGNSGDCFRSSTVNAQEWWEVDLGRTYPVSLIHVGTDTGNYLYPFTITVDGKYCARLPDDNKTSVHVACSSVIYGQVVRITRTQNGQLRLCDFQVSVPSAASYCEAGRWGASCQYSCSNKCGGGPGTNFCYRYTGGCYEENVVAGKNRQSSTLSPLYPPRLASNGYPPDCYRSDVIYTNEWWEVNLGGKYPVSNIHITASYSYLYPFKITVDSQLCVNETTAQRRSNPSVACSSVMYGQRVRITRTTRGRLQLCEVDINVPSGITKCPVGRHGEQCQLTCSNNCGEGPGTNFCYQNTGECYEVNVATGKTYSENSRYMIYPSSYAADENTNTCFRTYRFGNWQDWWEVDLGRKYPVHHFHITPYSSSYNSYLYPFTITVDGQMCVNETSFNSATFPTFSCPATMYGQVVRITSSPSLQFVLCEFEINVPSGVSRCEAGRWGPQCNHHCSNTCGGGPGNNFCFQGTGDCYDVGAADRRCGLQRQKQPQQ